MSPDPFTVPVDSDLGDAIRSLVKKGYSGAPVVDATGRVVGVLSEYDCVGVLAQAVAEGWPVGPVSSHMTDQLETVPPTEDVFALSRRFRRGNHRRLLVLEKDVLLGVITRRDLVRALESLEREATSVHRSSTYEAIEQRRRALD